MIGFTTVTHARLFAGLVSSRCEAGVRPTVAQLVNGGNGAEPAALAPMSIVPSAWLGAVGPVPV